jgi:uncharacterized membrane protein
MRRSWCAWTFSLSPELGLVAQVIWAIGVSMIILAALVHLRVAIVGAFGVALIATHNLFDNLDVTALGDWTAVAHVLHVQGPTSVGGVPLLVLYPLVAWIGVMAAGFAFGRLFEIAPARRARLFLRLGAGMIRAFVALRSLNGYGDPVPWTTGTVAP